MKKEFLDPKIIFKYVLTIIVFISCSEKNDDQEDSIIQEVMVKTDEYGIIVDSLNVITDVVKKNQTLTDLLLPHKVPFQKITDIAKESSDVFDLSRKINPNSEYKIYLNYDSISTLKYFIYKIDPVNYVLVDLTDSISVYKRAKEVKVIEKTLSGIINNSLYLTLKELNVSDLLALKLSEVYAWQIDFYRIQKGDAFTVVYEEQYVDDDFIGLGNIIAARFTHMKEDFFAVQFSQNDQNDYFDEEANSLRKVFLKAPLKFGRISSGYSYRRFHPILRKYRPHLGIDYAAPIGTPVVAIGDGMVTYTGRKGNNGRYVKIRHNSTYLSGYMHLSKYGKGIKSGVNVKQGQVIGYVGSSGLSTGPHLDFRFWKHGSLVNYLREKFPPTHPVKEENRKEYFEIRDQFLPLLIDRNSTSEVTTASK